MVTPTNAEIVSILETARDNITPSSYEFTQWHNCMCGHLYGATNQRSAFEHRYLISTPTPGTRYHQVLTRVAQTKVVRNALVPSHQRRPAETLKQSIAEFPALVVSDATNRYRMKVPKNSQARAAREFLTRVIEEIKGMDIGEEIRTIKVEPREVPIPQREDAPTRRRIPSREPDPTPEREPEKVPAE